MKVKMLGTSCTWFTRENTAYLIDDKIVLDIPNGGYKQILKNISQFDIEAVFISHLHSDHFGDLRVLLSQALWYPDQFKTKLKVYGPAETLDSVIELNRIMYSSNEEKDKKKYESVIDFVELQDGKTYEQNGYEVTAYKVEHGKVETYGFTFKDKTGKVVGFSADTRDCENLHKILAKSNFAFVEMSSMKKTTKHISTSEFVEYINQYKSCKLFPVHTSDESQQFAEENGLNALHDGDELIL